MMGTKAFTPKLLYRFSLEDQFPVVHLRRGDGDARALLPSAHHEHAPVGEQHV